MPYVASIHDVPERQPMVYVKNLLNGYVAPQMDNLEQKHDVESGADFNTEAKKCTK